MSLINFIDIETTGFYFKKIDRIVEFANIQYNPQENKVIKEDSFMVNPQIKIPNIVSNIHGIYNKDVDHLPDFSAHHQNILNIMTENSYIAGHNIDRFDIPFILQELLRYNNELPKNFYIIDTLLLAKKFIKDPNVKSFSLDNLCKYYNIDLSSRSQHDALIDCRLTLELFNALRNEYEMNDSLIFVDSEYILSKKLNYDISIKKEIVLPKYLNLINEDDNKNVIEYVKKEKALLPWINRSMTFFGNNINNYSCEYENKNFIPIISLTNKYKVICQRSLIEYFINLDILDNKGFPTKNGLENELVKFKIKKNNNKEVIYISFNQEFIFEHFSSKPELLKDLKIRSVKLIQEIMKNN